MSRILKELTPADLGVPAELAKLATPRKSVPQPAGSLETKQRVVKSEGFSMRGGGHHRTALGMNGVVRLTGSKAHFPLPENGAH